jgi:hypothetical protein
VNPNSAEVTADALLKVFLEVNRPKADAAIRKALQEPDAPQEAPPEQRPSVRKELEALRAAARDASRAWSRISRRSSSSPTARRRRTGAFTAKQKRKNE